MTKQNPKLIPTQNTAALKQSEKKKKNRAASQEAIRERVLGKPPITFTHIDLKNGLDKLKKNVKPTQEVINDINEVKTNQAPMPMKTDSTNAKTSIFEKVSSFFDSIFKGLKKISAILLRGWNYYFGDKDNAAKQNTTVSESTTTSVKQDKELSTLPAESKKNSLFYSWGKTQETTNKSNDTAPTPMKSNNNTRLIPKA